LKKKKKGEKSFLENSRKGGKKPYSSFFKFKSDFEMISNKC